MFNRYGKKGGLPQSKSLNDLIKIVSAEPILEDEKRRLVLEKCLTFSILEPARYDNLVLSLVTKVAQHVQLLPDSVNTYYSQPGGMLERSLYRTEAALELFKHFLVANDQGNFSEIQKLWQYTLISASLLQGIGKLRSDFSVQLYDNNGQIIKEWNPLFESMLLEANYYTYEFLESPDEDFRKRLNIVLACFLMPKSGYEWIASNKEVLQIWLALLNEDFQSAGVLGALLKRADAIAIRLYFNQLGASKNHGGQRNSRLGRMGTFAGGAEVQQDPEQVGLEFLQWLYKNLEAGKIIINKMPLLYVPVGLVLCAELFQLFIRDNPQYKNWQAVQKGFLALGLHQLNARGEIFSRFEHQATHQMYEGVVFKEFGIAVPDQVQFYNPATGKSSSISALELLHQSPHNNLLPKTSAHNKAEGLPSLFPDGDWKLNTATNNNDLQASTSFSNR